MRSRNILHDSDYWWELWCVAATFGGYNIGVGEEGQNLKSHFNHYHSIPVLFILNSASGFFRQKDHVQQHRHRVNKKTKATWKVTTKMAKCTSEAKVLVETFYLEVRKQFFYVVYEDFLYLADKKLQNSPT